MFNPLLRHKVNKCIKLVEAANYEIDKDLIAILSSDKYREGFNVLISSGFISCDYAWGGEIVCAHVNRTGFSVYKLDRSDVWANRIIGFVSGVLTAVIGCFIIQVLLSL